MTAFRYQAKTAEGETVAGKVDASSASDAARLLEERGLIILSLAKSIDVTTPAATESHLEFYRRVETAFSHRNKLIAPISAIAAELPGGLSKRELERVLKSLQAERTGKEFAHDPVTAPWLPLLLYASDQHADSGKDASLRVDDGTFARLLCSAIDATGLHSKRQRILSYPIIMLAIATFVLLLLSATVIPMLGTILRDFELQLPAATEAFLTFADFSRSHSWLVVLASIAGLTAFYLLWQQWTSKALTTRLFGPFIQGNSASLSAMAIFSRSLADLLTVSVPVPEALRIAGISCRHRYFRDAAAKLADFSIASGKKLSDCVWAYIFPANVIYAIEEMPDGQPDAFFLRELSEIYRARVSQRISWSAGFAGPLGILFIGAIVVMIFLSLFMPLIRLITGLAG
jgi:type II secretory pathway component PulF